VRRSFGTTETNGSEVLQVMTELWGLLEGATLGLT
jgi:hypothetical protein